jgi:hypothetical protein
MPRLLMTVVAVMAAMTASFSSLTAVAAAVPTSCRGALPGSLPAPKRADLHFGINPHVQAGQVGAAPTGAVPEDRSRQISNLRLLAGKRPFVLRLSRVFWPETSAQRAALGEEIADYSSAGFQIELQLRYHPNQDSPDNPAQFASWAAGIVHSYDANPALVSVQVTNEVNFKGSGDSSDGHFPKAADALIQGVEKAKAQAVADGAARHVKVGFNWFYRTDDAEESAFWNYLHDHGGSDLAGATDWVGLDAYPGTFFPPAESPSGGFYNGMVNAFSSLRDCYMSGAGFQAATPIYVEETGYPTNPGRSPETQVEALREIVNASRDYARVYNVTDFRWFDLRDADSAPTPNFQQHFGLLYSDYTPKPAFEVYRDLLAGDQGAQASPQLQAAQTTAMPFTAAAPAGHRGTALALLGGFLFGALLLGSAWLGAVLARRRTIL